MINSSTLTTEEKRNELNKEILSLLLVIDTIRADSNDEYYNYPANEGVSEDEFLEKNYELIHLAKEKLVDIFKD